MYSPAYLAGVRDALIKLSVDSHTLNPLGWSDSTSKTVAEAGGPGVEPLLDVGADVLGAIASGQDSMNRPVAPPPNAIQPGEVS